MIIACVHPLTRADTLLLEFNILKFLAFVAVDVHYRKILIKSLSSYRDSLNKLFDLFHACNYCVYLYTCYYSCNK